MVVNRSYQTATGALGSKKMLSTVAAGSALGVGALVTLGVIQSANESKGHTQWMRDRVRWTYGYVAAGLASTAGFAYMMFNAGVPRRIAAMNPWVFMGVSLVGTIGSMIATQAIDYQNTVMKHSAWMCFNGFMAASLCPLGVVGGPILMKAALATGAIVGSLSAIAAASPSDRFLNMGGALGVGLGCMFAASIGSMVFPASALLHNVVLYGGMGLFGLMLLYDTQRMMHHAEMTVGMKYDPINAGLGIYLDTIQIFWRMVAMMGGGGGRRK